MSWQKCPYILLQEKSINAGISLIRLTASYLKSRTEYICYLLTLRSVLGKLCPSSWVWLEAAGSQPYSRKSSSRNHWDCRINLKKTHNLDMIMWYWSADTLFWQLSYDHHIAVHRHAAHHRCGRREHTLTIHAASHVYHEKRDAWFSMHAFVSVPMAMVLCLVAFQAARAPLLNLCLWLQAYYPLFVWSKVPKLLRNHCNFYKIKPHIFEV